MGWGGNGDEDSDGDGDGDGFCRLNGTRSSERAQVRAMLLLKFLTYTSAIKSWARRSIFSERI